MTRRVPLSARTRASSPAVFMASMPTTHTKNAVPIHATKRVKKRRHKSHFNNDCYTSSNDESRGSTHTPMPSNGNASTSSGSKAKEIFYLSEGKKKKKWKSSDAPSPLALARVRSVIFQMLIWIGTKRSKTHLSRMLKLQTLKMGFKSKTCSSLRNDGPR
jgi:hypothetical protein